VRYPPRADRTTCEQKWRDALASKYQQVGAGWDKEEGNKAAAAEEEEVKVNNEREQKVVGKHVFCGHRNEPRTV
jgi:hypothetical protein